MNMAGNDGMEPITDHGEAVQPESRHTILGCRWFSSLGGHIGVVAARTGMYAPASGEWQAYIGVVPGWDEAADKQLVVDWGDALEPHEAHGFFPRLDITRYKGEEDEHV